MSQDTPKYLTLSELARLVRARIDDAHPLPYWVTAEISELKVNYSGHCYLELVEKGGDNHVPRARMSAVIWRSSYGAIASYFETATGSRLAAGIQVL
ncbi:MAG: exodeoxyribonuclease VII large subunit, partial [Rikenellaceae bacterium]|nr:exodeoxyribonuclease VII large subunit [Rikenellaceae bacterium]